MKMANHTLLYLGSVFVTIWGTAHLFPTKSVIKGFGNIAGDIPEAFDNEWITEAVTLIFLGLLVSVATYLDSSNVVSRAVYWLCFIMLNTLSIVSFFTGFRIRFLPFKLCPLIFSTASALILIGGCL